MGLLLGILPGCGTGAEHLAVTNPNSTTPKATIPEATTPEATTPEETTPEQTTPETTTPEQTTPTPTTPAEPKSFHLEFGEPVVVTQGAVGDNAWGHYQFPGLAYTLDGNIVASWNYTNDTIDDYVNARGEKVSTDGVPVKSIITRVITVVFDE